MNIRPSEWRTFSAWLEKKKQRFAVVDVEVRNARHGKDSTWVTKLRGRVQEPAETQ